MSQLITVIVKSVNIQNSKNGDPGLNIVCQYDDGSDHGKKIWQWIWREGNRPDPNLLKWALFADSSSTADTADDVLVSNKLSDTELDMVVDTEIDERFWKILSVGSAGALETSAPDDDDIPF